MKKIIFSLLSVALLLGACESRLDIEQKGVVATPDFYKTDDDAIGAVNNLYQSFCLHIAGNEGIYVALPVLFNEPGDDMWAAGEFYGDNDFGAALNEFRYGSENEVIRNAYHGLYAVIRSCNLILDNTLPETPIKKNAIAQARAIRAWAHFMLAIGWDTPPLVDRVLLLDEQPTNYEGGHDALLKWCAEEAEAAVADLDERESPTDQAGAAKITKGFAWTVAGKARLFMKDYEGAKTNLKQVINSKKYELVPEDRWASLFHASGDLCEEMIFQPNVVQNTSIGDWDGKINRTSWMFIQFWNWRTDRLGHPDNTLRKRPLFIGTDGWGGHAIRADFAERMLANDGNSTRRKATFLTGDEFLYELPGGWADPNNKPIDLPKEELEVSEYIGIHAANGLYGFEGYFGLKIVPWPEDNGAGWYGFKNLTIFRYAEVLLMYAEACAMTSDADGLGLKSLQDIQKRAGSDYVSTKLTLDDVKNEKSFEMWLEGVRWPDMVRWDDTSRVVDNGKKIPSTYDAFWTKKEPKHRIYVEYSSPNQGTTGFVAGKHEYFAFPYAVTSVNPNIKQNPSGL